jgi:pyruvate dehydrogenase E2 component (dihydrolipoamide acetyltransferase)
MAIPVTMPKFGFTQEESTIVAWLRPEGDWVSKGDPICEVTTDKVNMEVEAPGDGVLAGIGYAAGDAAPVTAIIAYLLAAGEIAPAGDEGPSRHQPGRPATPVAVRLAAAAGLDLRQIDGSGTRGKITRRDVEGHLAESGAASTPPSRVRATPSARRVAREHGLELSQIAGSGPRGRVQVADALAASPPATSPALTSLTGRPEIVPLTGLRRTIAERMTRSYQQAPHITFTLDVDMSAALALRRAAGEEESQAPSLTAILVRACAWALRQHPRMNSYVQDEEIWLLPRIDVGVAVALEDGLIVPVVHDADRLGIRALHAAIHDLTTRARSGKLRPDEVAGGTFTVSNLGMFGVDQFTAILNPPQVAILAAGRVTSRFVPDATGNPVARPLMTLTLSVDHRAIDGATAARFLATLRDGLEAPARMLL